jgi:hypothetical protein
MALDGFSSQDKAKVAKAVRLLQNAGEFETLRARTAKLPKSESMYIMRVAPAIRLIYQTTPNGIEILDVVQAATLHTFLNSAVDSEAIAAPARGEGSVGHLKRRTATSTKAPGRTNSPKLKRNPR